MSLSCKKTLLSSAVLAALSLPVMAALSLPVMAADKADDDFEHITIFGSSNPVNTVPGSAHLISEQELETFEYSDIMRTLNSVPGVYIMEEDGYGLRPNIGMRGTGVSRNEKITVMEDGVLIAPAAYASPSAYYFPTVGRMQGIEVLKGGSSIKYGPRTTGGVINLISRQIPDADLAGQVDLAIGEDGFAKLHGYAGGEGKNVAGLFEVYRYQADGFKDLPGGQDTGFEKNDFMSKVRFNSDKNARFYQELEFKLKYSDEDSDETYLGLTDEDYQNNPYMRYSASQRDNMSTEHKQIQINHSIVLSSNMRLGTTAYYNDFHRNWYKPGTGFIEDAAAFDNGTYEGDTLDVSIKANNRDYLAKGIQSELNVELGNHLLSIGARHHEDEMDRYQWVDDYVLDQNGNLTLTTDDEGNLTGAGIPGTDSNRIESADTFSMYVQDEFSVGDFSITAGMRYEDVTTRREDWGKTDPARTATPGVKTNSLTALMPSLGVTYQVNENLLVLGSVQKGFAPPAPGNNEAEEEESWNFETGVRFNQGELSVEAIGFFYAYDNMHGNCTAAQQCSEDNIGDQFNAGEVDVKGLELTTQYNFTAGEFSFPVTLAYTFTDSEFKNDFESDTWGDVVAGEQLPYQPEHILALRLGIVADNWNVNLSTRYMSEMGDKPHGSTIPADERVPGRTVVDLGAHYSIDKQQEIYLTVDNLLDKEYIATRTHGGIQVGKPRTAIFGYKYSF